VQIIKRRRGIDLLFNAFRTVADNKMYRSRAQLRCGRPANGCSTFGRAERIRVPLPAAKMMTSIGPAIGAPELLALADEELLADRDFTGI